MEVNALSASSTNELKVLKDTLVNLARQIK